MEYRDPLYGSITIKEQVVLDIISSPAVQRLKGVLQHGISGLIGVTTPITRFDHSMGVMMLVRHLGASLEEQVAALLHDVSHTAFSHVIDYVFDGHDSQAYHDEKKVEYVSGTQLPAILERHGYEWCQVLDEERYPLLEQPSPRLCADRLDYFLRDIRPLGLATNADIQNALAHLVVADGRIVTAEIEAARWIGYTFIAADEASWANFHEVGLYELTARAIRRALQIGVINERDFWLTDGPVWARMHGSADPELQEQLRLIHPDTQFLWDEEAPTFRISTKLRAVDPDVLVDDSLHPLSSLDPEFEKYRADYLARKRGKWPMRVIASAS